MLELFSCRNCVHNCAQSPSVGRGPGFCLQHESIIATPERTTCKYLHRKDLPLFVVDEGLREHAAEFAAFPRLVSLDAKEPIAQVRYSERHVWDTRTFDPMTHSLAQYHKSNPRWAFIGAFSGGVDGRRSLTYGSLIRHYMDSCGTWTSSYRMILALLENLSADIKFDESDITTDHDSVDALWDVVFARIGAIQEYGFHSGIEPLMWATDHLNGALVDFDWPALLKEFRSRRVEWIELVKRHAIDNGSYFPPPEFGASESPIVA